MAGYSLKKFIIINSISILVSLSPLVAFYFIIVNYIDTEPKLALILVSIIGIVFIPALIWGIRLSYKRHILGQEVDSENILYFGGNWKRTLKILYWILAPFLIPLFATIYSFVLYLFIILLQYLWSGLLTGKADLISKIILVVCMAAGLFTYIKIWLYLRRVYFVVPRDESTG